MPLATWTCAASSISSKQSLASSSFKLGKRNKILKTTYHQSWQESGTDAFLLGATHAGMHPGSWHGEHRWNGRVCSSHPGSLAVAGGWCWFINFSWDCFFWDVYPLNCGQDSICTILDRLLVVAVCFWECLEPSQSRQHQAFFSLCKRSMHQHISFEGLP